MGDFVPCLVPPSLPPEEGRGLSLSSVLLDDSAYISATAVFNATTAVGTMSTDKPIHVSFYLARPPRLSYMCVHFPGPAARLSATVPPDTPAVQCVMEAPQVLSTHADLALLRVPLPGSVDLSNRRHHDYFVYVARPGNSLLHRLPHPFGAAFQDNEVAILRCSGTSSRYVIAGLRNSIDREKFKLQRYDSDTRSWTSTLLSIHAPERDKVLPIPHTAKALFHETTKVITLGGPRGTIGWVDLWKGILFCDVLDAKPVLSDMPLPKPSRAKRSYFCRGSPHTQRDIAVITLPCQPIKIKYVDMETRPGMDDVPPSRHEALDSNSDSSDSECDLDVEPYWIATIWTMAVPISKWKDWHKDCIVDVTDIIVNNPRHSKLLLPLLPLPPPRLSTDRKTAIMSLRRLRTARPTLGLGKDGDLVIYLMCKVNYMDLGGWVIAIGANDKKLRGIAELDSRKNDFRLRCYSPTEIFKYLIKATSGESAAKCGAGAIYNREAAEEMDGADQGRQARVGQLHLGTGKEWNRSVMNHVEPRNICTSLQFGSFSLGMLPAGLQRCDEVVFDASILYGGPSYN